jgi:hypothetical protein
MENNPKQAHKLILFEVIPADAACFSGNWAFTCRVTAITRDDGDVTDSDLPSCLS